MQKLLYIPHQPATIVKRINRFVVEVKQDENEEIFRAWTNNTGRLDKFLIKDKAACCTKNKRPGKTAYRLFAVADGDMAAIIDTQFQMLAFEKALSYNYIPWLKGYSLIRINAPLHNSVIDYLFEHEDRKIYLEVKSAVLRENGFAMYPDCPSTRGQKHIKDLIDFVRNGGEAVVLFIAGLTGIDAFTPYKSGDPEIYRLLKIANEVGVELWSIGMAYNLTDSYIYLTKADLPVVLS